MKQREDRGGWEDRNQREHTCRSLDSIETSPGRLLTP
jgi:hypothetical protein